MGEIAIVIAIARDREAPVRFGYGLGVGRFEWFRFSVPAVPLQNVFFCVSVQFHRKGPFRCRFLQNGSGGSVFGFGKKVPTVPESYRRDSNH